MLMLDLIPFKSIVCLFEKVDTQSLAIVPRSETSVVEMLPKSPPELTRTRNWNAFFTKLVALLEQSFLLFAVAVERCVPNDSKLVFIFSRASFVAAFLSAVKSQGPAMLIVLLYMLTSIVIWMLYVTIVDRMNISCVM